MPKIINLKQFLTKLSTMEKKSIRDNNISVIVFYEKNYALKVHEDLEARHTVGQAKYLEQPARELQSKLGDTVIKAVKNKASLGQALVLAGLRLQAASQKLVPVDTGDLKGSAGTRKE